MDYRQMIQNMQNRTMAHFYRTYGNTIRATLDGALYLDQAIGAMPSIVNNKETMPPILFPPPIVTITATNEYTIAMQVFSALQSLLLYNASISLPPTKSARVVYLWFFTVASAYSWVTSAQNITGTKDNWNWDMKHVLSSEKDVFIWMTHVLANIMSNFVPSYYADVLLNNERTTYGMTEDEQTSEWQRVSASGNYAHWTSECATWYAYRGNDGNVAAATPPSNAVLPNGSTRLDVSVSQDISSYAEPRKWTPLKINNVDKNFLTYGWGDVLSTCLTGSDETSIKSASSAYYLGTTQARDTEIDSLVAMNNTLTDLQKVTAEFWAGGPTTVSPPAMMIWFWKKYVELTNPSINRIIYSGLELSINIFESSRMAWALKRQYMEDRPIQEIRRRYAGQNVKKYDGTTINGNIWVPYQESSFVTPPFADFPSGHSTFSQSFAKVMTAWFGAGIPTNDITMNDMNLLSPIFSGGYTNKLSNIRIPAKSSTIQQGVVPATDQTLSWAIWQDIADSAGVSRQYGGIHCASAHLGGQSLANSIYPLVTTAWSISRV